MATPQTQPGHWKCSTSANSFCYIKTTTKSKQWWSMVTV